MKMPFVYSWPNSFHPAFILSYALPSITLFLIILSFQSFIPSALRKGPRIHEWHFTFPAMFSALAVALRPFASKEKFNNLFSLPSVVF